MPDHAGPCIVQHPLYDPRGRVLIAAVGLHHGAVRLISLHLRLESELLDCGRRSEVAAIEECDHRGMPIQPPDLVTHGIGSDELGRLVPGGPILPLITAAPTG